MRCRSVGGTFLRRGGVPYVGRCCGRADTGYARLTHARSCGPCEWILSRSMYAAALPSAGSHVRPFLLGPCALWRTLTRVQSSFSYIRFVSNTRIDSIKSIERACFRGAGNIAGRQVFTHGGLFAAGCVKGMRRLAMSGCFCKMTGGIRI